MTTQADLLASALAHANKASISADEYLGRIFTRPTYAYKNTEWYRALKDLEAAKQAGSTPAPTPSDPLAPYRSILFMAQNTAEALAAPPYYKVAFTADPAYDQYARKALADEYRDRGSLVYVWYVPTEVSKARADEVAARLGAPVILGQCETAEQFDRSVTHGRRAMVGNLSALASDQLARVAAGTNVVVNEDYWGCGGGAPDWKNANAGVAGNCVAVYADGECSRMPLARYVTDGLFVPHRDSVYGPGMTAEDWAALRTAG